jgi:hypothetical protein
MRRMLLIAVCLLGMSAPLYAKEVTSTEVLSDLAGYAGKTITMSGLFVYSEPMRESFTVDQNGTSIEVFYRDLPRHAKDFVLAQKNHSRTPITVIAVVQPYTNRSNAFFLNATSLPGANSASDPSLAGDSVSYADIVSNPSKYIGKEAALKGLFVYSEPMRESFTIDQNGNLVEVFYRDLAKRDRELILAQKNKSKIPVFVSGTVQQVTNKKNAFFVNASSVSLGQ